MLKLKNVSKYYYKDGIITSGFTKVNLEFHMGEFVLITGESGSGKSTLLNVLSGLDSYEDGEMYINGEETSHYREEEYQEYRRKYVSNIFQYYNLVNSYTVYQNIELAFLMTGKSKKECRKEINDLIDKIKLSKFTNTPVSKLSGGQKQRVAIARALAINTPIIVADEPTGAIDSAAAKEIMELLYEVTKDKLVIVVTHNKKDLEKYATRLIKMSDGKILEDKIIEKVNKDRELVIEDTKEIKTASKIRLGLRNSFNIPIKFILMFTIFLLITTALVINYGIFSASEYESSGYGYSEYFSNISDKRIIIKKENGNKFNEDDYNKISKINSIDKIVKEDLVLDYLFDASSSNGYVWISGKIGLDKISKVSVGRMPEKENEIVVKGNKDNWYFEYYSEEMLEETFSINDYDGKKISDNIKIVGIIYDKETNAYNDHLEFYFSASLYNKAMLQLTEKYYNVKYIINENYLKYYDVAYNGFYISSKVNEGEIIVNENLNMYCQDYNCANKKMTIISENLYNKHTVELRVVNTFNSDNTTKLLNVKYDEADGYIFINPKDYNKIFSIDNYQSSVFVNDIKNLDDTVSKLNNLGYTTLSLREAKINEGEEILRILKIFKLIVTVVLIVVLFFISYFVIKIIYKSRISYYATIRTLGGTKNICTSILRNELITISSLVYSLFMIFIIFVKKEIIKFAYLKEIVKYIGFMNFLMIYIILIIMSIFFANRYGKKMFKNSIIKNYGERI